MFYRIGLFAGMQDRFAETKNDKKNSQMNRRNLLILFQGLSWVGTDLKIAVDTVGHHDIQHNDTQHKGLICDTQHKGLICDTQHKGLICDTQHNNTVQSAIMLSFVIYLLLC